MNADTNTNTNAATNAASTTIERSASTVMPRVLCALVALAAGIVGVAMLAVPGSTGRFFSWALGPPPLAALVGAFYVASTLVFGAAAARAGWSGLRNLCTAVFALTLPTLAATAHHRDVFDFGRWQAVAWVVLFVASPILFGVALSIVPRPQHDAGPRLQSWSRVALAVSGVVYAIVAVVLWAWPGAVASNGPITAGGLGLRFVGSWAAFLAALAALAVARPGRRDARLPVVALVVWPLAGLVAGLLHIDDLRPGVPQFAYLIGLCVLAALAGAVAIGDPAVRVARVTSRRTGSDLRVTRPGARAVRTSGTGSLYRGTS